jgi:hypothetical protein
VRDFMLNEALKRLAAEAATRFATLVASGDQIPFDVAEQEGPDSLFHSYVPLTADYVRAREGELRSLPAYEEAREAVEGAGVAADYLEQHGEPVAAEPSARADQMITVFIASLWDGCSDFALERDRLESALALVDAETCDAAEADVLIAPIVGLKMTAGRLRLPHGAQIVRADSIEAPLDAMRSEGMGRAAWEPQFLAVAEQAEGPDSVDAAMRQLRELISVMRLFKAGGVGLGPYAFAPTGEGTWRRIATGAPAARPGGYALSAEEVEALEELARALEARPDPSGALAWGVRRFELGCERPSALEGLSDHLLALRAVLEGQGPVGASLPMRAAALLAGGQDGRHEVRERVEGALGLERSLMRGSAEQGSQELADWLEEGVRSLLREAALGELGTDLGTAADETLIAAGLSEGDADISVAVQVPELPDEDSPGKSAEGSPGIAGSEAYERESVSAHPYGGQGQTRREPSFAHPEGREPAAHRGAASPSDRASSSGSPSDRASSSDFSRGSEGEAFVPEDVPAREEAHRPDPATYFEVPDWNDDPTGEKEQDYMDEDTRILEPIPDEGEIRITATNWLEEVEGEQGAGTIEWPAGGSDIERRERVDTPRVRHIFPVPEDADWEVRELKYDHYERRRTG